MDLSVHAAPKPKHSRRVPKRVDRGKFSNKTIKEISERDGYQCIRCGSYYIEKTPHHIIYKSQGGTNDKRNGVTICRGCHEEAHSKKEVRKWFEQFQEEKLDENGDKR